MLKYVREIHIIDETFNPFNDSDPKYLQVCIQKKTFEENPQLYQIGDIIILKRYEVTKFALNY